ncbi:MAG: hypothetical protein ACXWEJ_03000 [Actinomycetota bacterium]
MSNKRKRKARPAPRPSGYRDPRPAAAPARKRGILDSLFAARVPGSTSMPRVRTAITRGVITVLGSPTLVVAPVLYLLLVWLVLVAAGYQGPFAPLANLLALPPIGTSLDASLATSLFGLQGGLFGIIVFLAARAIALSLLTAAVVEALEDGRVTRAGMRRGLRALPVTFAICIIGVGILTLSSFFGPLLGPGFGILLQVGALVVGLYLFTFAPIIAVDEGRTMPESLGRSIRAARLPGAGNLMLAALYVVPSIAVIVAPGKPGNLIGVNPTIGAWVFALLINLLHVALLATFAFRYLSVAHEVPEPPERPPASTVRGRR